MAASATFALKAGVWFRRGRLIMVSPDSQATACPSSGRNSTYRPVQISGASSEFADVGECMLLVFTQDSVPTWEVRRRSNDDETDLIVSGTADTFDAAKAAAYFEAFAPAKTARSRRA